MKRTTPQNHIDKMRNLLLQGYTKIQIAEKLGYAYSTVKKYTKDLPTDNSISIELQNKIRSEVKKGKSKRQVAVELNISRDSVIKYTKDIFSFDNKPYIEIPKQKIEHVIKDFNEGRSFKEISRRHKISVNKIVRYTRRPSFYRILSIDLIQKIREEVKSGKTKIKTAEENNVSYYTVLQITKDIDNSKKIPLSTIKKIRKECRQGYPKNFLAEKYKIHYSSVRYYTKDIRPFKNTNGNKKKGYRDIWSEKPDQSKIKGKTLLLLKELMHKGYAFPNKKYGNKEYYNLKKEFPMIHKVKTHGRVVYFLEDKVNIAIKEFLSITKKRKISFNEVSSIIKTFYGKNDNFKRKELIKKTIYRQ
jgi:DNA-binding CsgD family transcriptional regulator